MLQQLKRLDVSIGAMVADGAKLMLVLFLSVAAVIGLTYQRLAVSHRYPLDYGEAPLLDQAMRLAAGQNIYRADLSTPPYVVSNYPPLYVVALIPFLNPFGPSFLAGRAISAFCAWASGACLGWIVYAHTRDRLAGVMTGLLFFSFPFVVSWSSLLRVDLLALALSLAGLCLLAAWPASRGRLLAAAILLVAAIFTRQSYALAAPLAGFVWLWAHDWRQAVRLAVWVGGLSLILFLLLNGLTQGGFYYHIVTANVNEFGMDRLVWNLRRFRDAALPLLFVGGTSLFLIRRWNPSWPLAAPYLVGALLSALTIGKIGSNVNYFLELCAALSLAAGLVVAWSRRHVGIHVLRGALPVLLALQTGRLLQITLDDYALELTQRREAVGELADLNAMVRDAEGPILADEYMGLLTLQGRPLTIQPFEMTQLALAGLWDQSPLVQRIRNQEFPLILIHYFPEFEVYKERWTPEMLSAIDHAYLPTDSLADTRVYRPRRSPASTESCPGAPWRLPSSDVLSVQWKAGGLDFYGRGSEGAVPVFAVADGRLTRSADWIDAVAIRHEDPLQAGRKVWSFYANMVSANGVDSYIAPDFPPGITDVPVKAGQLLGYQGAWSGRAMWPVWIHVHFSVVPATEQGAFPSQLATESALDPSRYLNVVVQPQAEDTYSQPLRCGE